VSHLKLFLLGIFGLAILFLLASCANQPAFCPEIKINFCPVR